MTRVSIRPRRPALWQAYLLLAAAPAIASPMLSPEASGAVLTAAALAATLATLAALAIHRPESRAPWLLLAAGQTTFLLGDVVWQVQYGRTLWAFPSAPDAFFLSGYALFALGFGLLVARRSLLPDWHMFLDAGVATSGVALFGWVVFVDPLLANTGLPPSEHLRDVTYTLGDIGLCFIMACLLVAPGTAKPNVRLFALALGAAIAGDVLLGYTADPEPVHGIADAALIVRYALFGAAALHPSIAWTPPIRRRSPRLTMRRMIALACAASLAPIILITAGTQRAVIDYWVIGVGWLVTVLLVLACVIELVREQADTLRQQLVLEQTLRETSELLRGVVDASPLGILVVDVEGRVRFWSRAAERMYGFEPAEVMGRPAPIVPADGNDQFTALLGRAFDGEAVMAADLLRVKKDGSPIRIRTYMAPMRDEDGNVWAAIALHEDMREISQLQAELFEARKMESVGRLAGGIAHDFNNILTAIIGFADLSLAHPDAPDLQTSLAAIKSSAERAAGLTQQLLAFSRRQMLQPQVIGVNAALLSVEAMLRRLIGEHVSLEISLAESEAYVRADPTQLQQVLLNLAINARDAMPDGGRLSIRIARHAAGSQAAAPFGDGSRPAAAPDPYVTIEVTDTGFGMDEATKAHIFEPFFTTKEQGRGTGLGLATTYGIVTQSGGTIQVESAPGAGSTFTLSFPTVEPETAAAPQPVQHHVGAGRILLVEDEAVLRDLARRVLVRAGFEVTVAEDPLRAIALSDATPADGIDLLLTDVVMPGMRGPELARRLRERRPGLRVVLTSGYAEEIVAKEMAGGAFLAKPFTPDDLLRAVDRAMHEDGEVGQARAEEPRPDSANIATHAEMAVAGE